MAKVVAAAREALERIDRGDGALDDLASALEQDPAATLSLEDISKTVNYGESTVADGE
jgi:hypothetical protein